MVLKNHCIFFLLAAIFAVDLFRRPKTKEEFDVLRPARKAFILQSVKLARTLIWLFPLMNLMIQMKNPEAFSQSILFQFVGSAVFCFMIKRAEKMGKTGIRWPWLTTGVLFFLYTLLKNILLRDSVARFFVAECISLAATAFFFCASYYIPHPTDYITENEKTGDS